jgi:hypothetical protein
MSKFKEFFAKKILERQMKKSGMPEANQKAFMSMYEKNPVLFEKIAKETDALIKQGKSQTEAAMAAARKYQSELSKLNR